MANRGARQEETSPIGFQGGVDGEQIDRPRVPGQRRHQRCETACVRDEQRTDLRLRRQKERPAPEAAGAEDQRAIDRLAAAVDAQRFAAVAEVGEQCADETAVECRVAAIQLLIQVVPVRGERRKGIAGGVDLPSHSLRSMRFEATAGGTASLIHSRCAAPSERWLYRCRSRR